MREATDLGVSAGVRRELTGRRIDLTKLKFPVKNGVISIQGELSFVGMEKTNDEIAIELKFIESSLKSLKGAKEVHFELSNWAKNEAGVWESKGSKNKTGSAPIATGEGIKCPDCDYVIRYCPCCGKPLAGAAKHSPSKTKRPRPPVKPVARKKRPLSVPPVAARKPEEKATSEQDNKPKEIKSPSISQQQPESESVKTPEPAVPNHAPTTDSGQKKTQTPTPKPLPPLKPLGERTQDRPQTDTGESDSSQQPVETPAPAETDIPEQPAQQETPAATEPEQVPDLGDLNLGGAPEQPPQQQPPAASEPEQVPDLGDLDLSDFTLNEENNKQDSQQPAEPGLETPTSPVQPPEEPAAPQQAPAPAQTQTPQPPPASPVPSAPQPESPPFAEQQPQQVEPVSSAPHTPPQQPEQPSQTPAAPED
ncbi:MAG: hypothetical protein ACQETH_11255, partial [Candidatus Rifleibacteriota bacterium]